MSNELTPFGQRMNDKQLRSYSIRREMDFVMRENQILKSRKAENAVTLFIRYCVNYTSCTSFSDISSSTLEDYIQHHIGRPNKSREYDSFKGLKNDVKLLEQLISNSPDDTCKLDFSLMNTNLWSSEENMEYYKSRKNNFFLQ
ncbi:swarming motility protein SwrAA [Bacillus sp. SJS]|uniref:swarming motility protein SwrAA n=1 Tax=Bacillus sp. SJS TaxID=1423321 RepID=UPI0004DD42B3|nr:swarming motility protein SwrAA [Bacillus sp. SJS]KZZ85034.1 hypothetical protein AS29_008275 [Bacillus sp. SJS]